MDQSNGWANCTWNPPLRCLRLPYSSRDPAIDHVNFTVWWQGVDPRKWVVACAIRSHTSKDVFTCDVKLSSLGAPAGQLRISFDVYDKKGNANLAPNGEHTITYLPASK